MLFEKGTRKNTGAEAAKEGVEYVILKDGNGTENKLLNLDHIMYAPKEGIVELEPTKVSKYIGGADRNMADVTLKVIRDKNTGYLIGIPLTVDPKTKNIIWERINLKGREVFDLSIPDQRMKWICIKNSYFYINSPNLHKGCRLVYRANDKEESNKIYELTRRIRRKATDIADTLEGEELEEMAMMIGLDPNLMSKASLFTEVSKFVENPNRMEGGKTGAEIFMELYDSPTRIELSILKRGLATGILESTYDKGIIYRGTTLGFNESEVIKYLHDHPNTKTSIDLQSKSSQEGTQQSMRKAPEQMSEADAKIARLEKQLAEKDNELKKEREIKLDALSDADIEEINPEYAGLLEEAKRLGIRGAHLLARKGTIEDKIVAVQEKITEHSKLKKQ